MSTGPRLGSRDSAQGGRAPLIAPAAVEGSTKFGAARLSIASNSALIVLKIVAGALTGSIAIVTEAVHSSIDLIASVVAYVSLRKADEPADESHMYGHAKIENLAAAIEGMLILIGAGVIVFEAVRRLDHDADLEKLGFGIVVIGLSATVNLSVSAYLYRQSRRHDSPALEADAAHLRADSWTSLAVLGALVLVAVTGVSQFDAIMALIVASAIVYTGIRILSRSSRVLVDEALPADELDLVRTAIEAYPGPELAGYHKLRGRRAGSARYIDLHLQFAHGTSLEQAHSITHLLQEAIRKELPGAEVLVHIEPARSGERASEPTVPPGGFRAGG
jgi:cation diffusion facilitator family transporter